jgi:hypothetical protein
VVQCALYDLGGEGIAYHDTDALNNGSGKLNLEVGHQRVHKSYHHWNLAEIGTITFPTAGLQVLTFHYGKGNNFAYFDFEPQ